MNMLGKAFNLGESNKIEGFSTRLIDVDLDLYYCGVENCIKNFFCGPMTRNFFLIHYIVKGKGFYILNNERYELSQGDIFTIFPGDITYYATYPEDPWSFCWFAFNGKKAIEQLKSCGITKTTPVKAIMPECAPDDLIQDCVHTFFESKEPIKTKLQGYLYLIFAKIQESYINTEKIPELKVGYAEYIRKALLFIEYNYIKPITVQTIANYVALERTYFSKIFSRSTGMCPQNYLIHYRIEKATHMIETTALSLKQIGMSVGIPNEYYFSKLFKKIKGVPPKRYRSTHQ